MADRYQDRPFPADDDYNRGDHRAPAKGDSDPLAELARLIGQTDPFTNFGRDAQAAPSHADEHDQFHSQETSADAADEIAAGPPPWMQHRAARSTAPPDDFESAPHPLLRRAATYNSASPDFQPPQPESHQADHDRYDDALFGQAEADPALSAHDAQFRDGLYQDDAYADQDGYDDGTEDQARKRRGGMMTVAVVLALAVVGTGAAFAYRTYMGSQRSGEPPVIKADAGPNKIVPQSATGASGDAVGKLIQDRMTAGNGSEQMVSREEQPVDVKDATKSGPRVVFPPLNQNANPPSAASVAPGSKPAPVAANGTIAGDEPRKIRTLAVHGDQADPAAVPVARQPASQAVVPVVARRTAPAPNPVTNTPSANAPLSLSPQGAPAADIRTRVASTTPAPQQIAPAASSGGGGYVVQVSSQRNEADAQASFRALQGKFPSVLGSRSPLIKRADLGAKGVYYRAMVGPFGSPDEASHFCGSLKSAGGQCVVQRN